MPSINCTEGCPCMEPCPLLYAMRKIGSKWKITILCVLKLNGATRYNVLLRKVNGITNTMLAASLKELEQDGLVKRTEYLEVPVRVEYSLTEKCALLFPAFEALIDWSRYMQADEAAGASADAPAGAATDDAQAKANT